MKATDIIFTAGAGTAVFVCGAPNGRANYKGNKDNLQTDFDELCVVHIYGFNLTVVS